MTVKLPYFQALNLQQQIRWLRLVLPAFLVLFVVIYQLGLAVALEERYGHTVHYAVEIGFYSFAGPIAVWLILNWVDRQLTRQARLEQEVQQHAQQLASLTAASADAILSLDRQGRILSWNEGAVTLFGYAKEEMVGRPLSPLLRGTLPPPHLAGPDHRPLPPFETTGTTQDGHSIAIEGTHTRLDTPALQAPASLLILRDVTLRHERESLLAEERARIARDLHDGVAQTLYFLALQADLARQRQAAGQANGPILHEIGQKARQTIREVRRTIFALQPHQWEPGHFLQELPAFVQRYAEQTGWQATVTIAPEVALPPSLEPALFRLVQEALNNVAKHASASQIQVTLQGSAGQPLRLVVQDNGQGYDPGAASSSSGFGLGQMRSQVAHLGGEMNIEGRENAGTILTITLPPN